MKKMWGINDDKPTAEDIKRELGISKDMAHKVARWTDKQIEAALETVLDHLQTGPNGLTAATTSADRYMGMGVAVHGFLSTQLPLISKEFQEHHPQMSEGMMDALCKLMTAHLLKNLIEGADELKDL